MVNKTGYSNLRFQNWIISEKFCMSKPAEIVIFMYKNFIFVHMQKKILIWWQMLMNLNNFSQIYYHLNSTWHIHRIKNCMSFINRFHALGGDSNKPTEYVNFEWKLTNVKLLMSIKKRIISS
jgi:hypothetical protein